MTSPDGISELGYTLCSPGEGDDSNGVGGGGDDDGITPTN